ncbi:MAG TPA: flagellar motor switch protein FliM [Bryobacteraceae bacterium]|nr:flagellar motor switch protein FliM [Bryobacteraceae bacterium]
MAERVLTQEEIDSVFRKLQRQAGKPDATQKVQVYDFRRPDRIAKDQLRSIHLLHENFVRGLSSSLSAYLRAYVAVNLLSVEQLAFAEFVRSLPSPTSLVALGMKPYDGNALLEISPSLVFPILEMLLGGDGLGSKHIDREITEIEHHILDGLLRIILQDLRTAWHTVTAIEFSIDGHKTEPQLLQILAPNEAVVCITMEVRIGETTGTMNLGIPSILVKMLRQKFDQQWTSRRAVSTEGEHERALRLLRPAELRIDARLEGARMRVDTLLELQEGDVVAFDYPVSRPLSVTVNGAPRYRGEVVAAGRKRAVQVQELLTEA